MPGNLPTTYLDPLGPLSQVRMGSKLGEIRTDSSASFQFRRLPVRPVDRSGLTHSGNVGSPAAKTTVYQGPEKLQSDSSCL